MKRAYIHVPFCKKICSYCDFCKVYPKESWVKDYLKALQEEIETRYQGEPLETIYIGGGTPSSLSLENTKELLSIIHTFNKEKKYEYTIEMNVNDISLEKLSLYKEYGVNRLSIGIQSFSKRNLKFMERNHTYKEVKGKIQLARSLGFDNINLDLIYAIPKETSFTLKQDLKKFIKLNPEHISTYSLLIEDHTKIKNQNIEPIPEEKDAKFYNLIKKYLSKKGYMHYEVSNFAKEGYESKHNTGYWKNEEYYGFGPGAHGYIGDIRYENTRSITSYIKGNTTLKESLLSKEETMDTEIMLGLRLLKGISLTSFQEKYGIPLESHYKIENLLAKGELEIVDNYLRIPEKYIYVMDSILLEIL